MNLQDQIYDLFINAGCDRNENAGGNREKNFKRKKANR